MEPHPGHGPRGSVAGRARRHDRPGACILAAAGTLHPNLSAATAAMSVTGTQVDPDDTERDALEANYRRFRSAVADRGWTAD